MQMWYMQSSKDGIGISHPPVCTISLLNRNYTCLPTKKRPLSLMSESERCA